MTALYLQLPHPKKFTMIKTLDQLAERVTDSGRRYRIAVAWGQDPNTLGALDRAVKAGFAEPLLIGNRKKIEEESANLGIDTGSYTVIEENDEAASAVKAVEMVRGGSADILMKGALGTDKFLKAVLDKSSGLMKPGAVLSYVCAVQVPDYHKLLFVTDTAVLPFPDLDQKVAMARYAVGMAHRFGIVRPKVALIGATEKVSGRFPNSVDYAAMCKMAERGQISGCIMDGPVDIFLACDPASASVKGVETPLEGDADILLFPTLESCNPFYKGLMLFGKGELAGMLTGTTHPVVLMSRSESENSKFYCIALSCLMAGEN
jgi:phosphate butyryltransferase